MGLDGIVPPGVVTGANLLKLMEYCRDNKVAIPGNFIIKKMHYKKFKTRRTRTTFLNCMIKKNMQGLLTQQVCALEI